jgi:molybdopterin converting factor small subunit
MAKIKLKIIGLPQRVETTGEDTIDAENLWDVLLCVESKYPQDYYSLNIFLNGVSVDDKSKSLRDGDDVVIIPIMSGG